MAAQFSLAHLTLLGCSPDTLVDIASETGYDFVSIRLNALTQDELSFPLLNDASLRKKVKTRLSETGIEVLDMELALLSPDSQPNDHQPLLEVAADLGARHIICQLPDEDKNRATDKFCQLCELARPYGLSIDLEFPSWMPVGNLQQALDIVEAANKSNAGILVDTLHFYRSSSSLSLLKQVPDQYFHFIHLCDATAYIPTDLSDLLHTARKDRCLLGEGQMNVDEMITAMPCVPYSLEIPNERMRAELGDVAFARAALNAAKAAVDIAFLSAKQN